MGYSAKILLDSIGPNGARLTTFELTYPRMVHAELMTHRLFSRNSASSRPRLVIIESPFGTNPDGSRADAATVERNVRYVRGALADCLRRGEAPCASHALYTLDGVLDDTKPEERKLGLEAGWAWGAVAAATIVYCDYGLTAGMQMGINKARGRGQPVVFRAFGHGDPTVVESRVMGRRPTLDYESLPSWVALPARKVVEEAFIIEHVASWALAEALRALFGYTTSVRVEELAGGRLGPSPGRVYLATMDAKTVEIARAFAKGWAARP